MKRVLVYLLAATLCASYGFCRNGLIEQDVRAQSRPLLGQREGVAPYLKKASFPKEGVLQVDQNPSLSLNPQDAPLFYNNNPLTGLKAFTVVTSFPLKDPDTQKSVQQSIEKALSGIGEVVHLRDNDMRGFGAGSILLIQMGNVKGWDGSEMSACRLSLSVETPVTLDKTDMKTFPMIWSINVFLQGEADSTSEDNLTKAIQKLMGDFVQNYKYANQSQEKKPVFYIYD